MLAENELPLCHSVKQFCVLSRLTFGYDLRGKHLSALMRHRALEINRENVTKAKISINTSFSQNHFVICLSLVKKGQIDLMNCLSIFTQNCIISQIKIFDKLII